MIAPLLVGGSSLGVGDGRHGWGLNPIFHKACQVGKSGSDKIYLNCVFEVAVHGYRQRCRRFVSSNRGRIDLQLVNLITKIP